MFLIQCQSQHPALTRSVHVTHPTRSRCRNSQSPELGMRLCIPLSIYVLVNSSFCTYIIMNSKPLIQFLMLEWLLHHKIIPLLFHNYNFAIAISWDVSIWSVGLLRKGRLTPKGSRLTGWEPLDRNSVFIVISHNIHEDTTVVCSQQILMCRILGLSITDITQFGRNASLKGNRETSVCQIYFSLVFIS